MSDRIRNLKAFDPVPSYEPTDAERLRDVSDRCRRIETRLTKFLEAHGHATIARLPEWRPTGEITIHDVGTPISEMLRVVPDSWNPKQEIIVNYRKQFMFALFLDEDSGDNHD